MNQKIEFILKVMRAAISEMQKKCAHHNYALHQTKLIILMGSFIYEPTSFLYTRAGRIASTSNVEESHLHKCLAGERTSVLNESIFYVKEPKKTKLISNVKWGADFNMSAFGNSSVFWRVDVKCDLKYSSLKEVRSPTKKIANSLKRFENRNQIVRICRLFRTRKTVWLNGAVMQRDCAVSDEGASCISN